MKAMSAVCIGVKTTLDQVVARTQTSLACGNPCILAANAYRQFGASKESVGYQFFADQTGWLHEPTATEVLGTVLHKLATVLETELRVCRNTGGGAQQLFVSPKLKVLIADRVFDAKT